MISAGLLSLYLMYLLFLVGFFVFTAFSLFHLEQYGYVGDFCRAMMVLYGLSTAAVMLGTFVALIAFV